MNGNLNYSASSKAWAEEADKNSNDILLLWRLLSKYLFVTDSRRKSSWGFEGSIWVKNNSSVTVEWHFPFGSLQNGISCFTNNPVITSSYTTKARRWAGVFSLFKNGSNKRIQTVQVQSCTIFQQGNIEQQCTRRKHYSELLKNFV